MKYKLSKARKVPPHVSAFFKEWAKSVVGGNPKITKESHGDEGAVYKIESKKETYFLKIKMFSNFSKERERLAWLEKKLLVPKVIDYKESKTAGALLLSALPGKNLASLSKEWPADKVIAKLAQVLRDFHKTPIHNWPLKRTENKKVLVHGDACLPNFIFNGETFSGYIDVADCVLGYIETDLAAAVWSIQYNLGKGYGTQFLKKYGYPVATEKMAQKLLLRYEKYQQAHGFL